MEERFWKQVEMGDEDECWEWQAGMSGDYGWFSNRGDEEYAHRVSFELSRGYEPEDMVLHHCDNPPCVNPAHLYGGTAADNIQDSYDRDRRGRPVTHRGVDTPNAHLTPHDVREIRRRYADGEVQVDLSEKYETSQSHISRIIRGESWAWLDDG